LDLKLGNGIDIIVHGEERPLLPQMMRWCLFGGFSGEARLRARMSSVGDNDMAFRIDAAGGWSFWRRAEIWEMTDCLQNPEAVVDGLGKGCRCALHNGEVVSYGINDEQEAAPRRELEKALGASDPELMFFSPRSDLDGRGCLESLMEHVEGRRRRFENGPLIISRAERILPSLNYSARALRKVVGDCQLILYGGRECRGLEDGGGEGVSVSSLLDPPVITELQDGLDGFPQVLWLVKNQNRAGLAEAIIAGSDQDMNANLADYLAMRVIGLNQRREVVMKFIDNAVNSKAYASAPSSLKSAFSGTGTKIWNSYGGAMTVGRWIQDCARDVGRYFSNTKVEAGLSAPMREWMGGYSDGW
jgi:hypothetical protein